MTTSATQHRLPTGDARDGGPGEKAFGVLTIVGTLAVVVGVPIALLATAGPPWPSEMPTMQWLAQPSTTEAVLATFAVVVWLAWAHFVLCLVVEAVAAVRHRGISPRVPGGGLGSQALARHIVVTATVLLGLTAASVGPASAVSGAAPDGAPTASASSEVMPGSAAAPGQAPSATPEVVAQGTVPSSEALMPATQDDLKGGATTYYEVNPPRDRHYDTLWDISERYLGDGRRYKEIVELNQGLTQPDGTQLRNPDLIYPGWVLRLPSDAAGPGLRVVEHVDPAVPGSSDQAGAHAQGIEGVADASATEGESRTEGASFLSRATAVASSDWAPLFGIAGGLAFGGAYRLLRRRRAAMSTGELWAVAGASGPDPTPTPDGPGPGGRLRDEANPELASWLARTLSASGIGNGVPAPAQVSVGAAGLAMSFDEAPTGPPPAGWTAVNDRVWAVGDDVRPHGGGPAPMPGLVTVGRRDDGSLLLIDPEGVAGVVSVEGPEDLARGVAVSMAVDTATHPWADQRTVTLVGFADGLTAAGAGNIRQVDDLARVIEGLENRARYHRGACQQAGLDSAREARVVGPHVADWSYQLVVCSGVPAQNDLVRLDQLAADAQVALGVVVIGQVPAAGMRLWVQQDGRLTSPMHGIDVQAQCLDVGAAQSLAELYQAPPSRSISFEDWAGRVAAEAPRETATAATVRISILGPVAVEAPGEVDAERSAFLAEAACFLALNPGGVHVNRLTAALWPRGVEVDVRDQAMRQLGQWLGGADGQPVLREEAGVWSLRPGVVALDWDEFRADVNAAAAPGAPREQLLRRALNRVQGLPFADAPAGRYAWLESAATESNILLALALVTHAVADSAVEREDASTARAALVRTLELLPGNQDLWRVRLRLEARFATRDVTALVADAMYEALAQHAGPVGATGETEALVSELLPGYQPKVAMAANH